jgi:precorrin-3B synthase
MVLAAGLASADPAVEAVRNVMASPLGADDPAAAFDAHAPARDIEAMLAAEPALQALPGKFGILVDGGGALPLADVAADIMVRASDGRLAVTLDGGSLAALCAPSRLVEAVKALALAFLHLSWERREPPHRLRDLVAAIGESAVFDAAGLTPMPKPAGKGPSASPIGFAAYPGRDEGWFGAGLPFGRIEADTLTKLADFSERFGDGTLRTTPWRTLLLPAIAANQAPALAVEIRALGLISDPTDPRLYICACVGAPSCQSASVDARNAARRLAAALAPTRDKTIHVSGCAKSCAHRGSAALTLVGRDGRYDVVRNGGASDRPSLTGLSLDEVLALVQSAKGRTS